MSEGKLNDKESSDGSTAVKDAPEKKAPKKAKIDQSKDLTAGETRQSLHTEEKWKIIISSTESEKADVPVSINGHAFVIKRDEEVAIPKSVLTVLQQAKADTYVQVKRADGLGMGLEKRETMRYPVQVLGPVGA